MYWIRDSKTFLHMSEELTVNEDTVKCITLALSNILIMGVTKCMFGTKILVSAVYNKKKRTKNAFFW